MELFKTKWTNSIVHMIPQDVSVPMHFRLVRTEFGLIRKLGTAFWALKTCWSLFMFTLRGITLRLEIMLNKCEKVWNANTHIYIYIYSVRVCVCVCVCVCVSKLCVPKDRWDEHVLFVACWMFDELHFWSISNLNFTGYSRQKNLVQTRKKVQNIKLDISNQRIAKIKCR